MSLSPFALASRLFQIKIGRVFSLLQMICIIFLALSLYLFSLSPFFSSFFEGGEFCGCCVPLTDFVFLLLVLLFKK